MIIYNRTQYKKLTDEQYQEEKRLLQIELLKLQEWIINNHKSVAILFEGRDAAGKGATIRTVSYTHLTLPTKRIV